VGGDELGLLGMKRLLVVLRWRKRQIGGCWCGGGRGKSGAVAERLCARKGMTGRGKGKELKEEEGNVVLCSLVLFWQRGSVLMTGQGDGGQVLRGK
jgi:hypothetical protein